MSDALRVALARCALDAEGAPMSAWSDLLNATTSALSDEESLATSTVDMAQLLALVERAAKRDDVDDAVDSLVDTAIDTISSTSSTSTSTSISSTTSSTSSTSIDALSPTVCAAYQQHVVLDDSSTLLTSEMRRSISQTQLAVSTNSAELAAWWFAVDSQRSALAVALVLTCWNVAPRQRRRAPVERLVDCAVGDATTSPLPALLLAVVFDHSATDIEMLGLCHGALPLVLTRLRECARLPLRPARVVLQMCCRLARVVGHVHAAAGRRQRSSAACRAVSHTCRAAQRRAGVCRHGARSARRQRAARRRARGVCAQVSRRACSPRCRA
jgi:hypothetical protein